MWMFSMCSGFLGKLAGPLLTAKQQHADPALKTNFSLSGFWRRSSMQHNCGTSVSASSCQNPLVVYSDASFQQGVLRLGWVIYPRDQPPIGGTCVVPREVIASWTPRTQQIFPGESICALVVPYLWPDVFRNTDVLWFIDNEAAVSSLVKSTSKELDVRRISQATHALLGLLSSRCWFEWIDSDSNPADGLSREGLHPSARLDLVGVGISCSLIS